MGRPKSFADLSEMPIVTRIPESSRARVKELAKHPGRRTLNALMAEVMHFFLKEKPYGKGLKLRIPKFTVRFDRKTGDAVRTGWRQINIYLPQNLMEDVLKEVDRLRNEEKIPVTLAIFAFSSIFWWLNAVEPEGDESRAYYDYLKKEHGEFRA